MMPANHRGIYSAWNWQTGQYDYYRLNRPLSGYGDEVKHPRPRYVDNPIGESPEQSASRLPAGVRRIGSGATAMGEVVAVDEMPSGVRQWGAVALAVLVPSLLLWATANLGRVKPY